MEAVVLLHYFVSQPCVYFCVTSLVCSLILLRTYIYNFKFIYIYILHLWKQLVLAYHPTRCGIRQNFCNLFPTLWVTFLIGSSCMASFGGACQPRWFTKLWCLRVHLCPNLMCGWRLMSGGASGHPKKKKKNTSSTSVMCSWDMPTPYC